MSASCHHLAKDYLQCRMDKGLMAKENLDNLGFAKRMFFLSVSYYFFLLLLFFFAFLSFPYFTSLLE
jgi:hypothetical protein